MTFPRARNALATKESHKEWRGHAGAVLDSVGGYDAIACEHCGFVHMAPLPTEAELASIYQDGHSADTEPDDLVRMREDGPQARHAYDDRLELLISHLPAPRRRLLDIGCGSGFFVLRAIERGFAAEGIDPSRQACAYARTLGVAAAEACYDDRAAGELGSFDAITLTNVLEHVADPTGLIARAYKTSRRAA